MVNKFRKNFILSCAYELVTAVYPLIMLPYISRVLGTEGVGVYSYHYAIAGYFAMFCIWGINAYGNRNIASCLDNHTQLQTTFNEIYSAQIFISLPAIVIYLCYSFCLGTEQRVYSLILSSILIAQAINPGWFLLGIGEVKVLLFRNIFVRVISALLIFVFVHNSNDLVAYFIINGITVVSGAIITLYSIKRYIMPSLVTIAESKKHFVSIIKLFLPVLALNSYAYIDKILIGIFHSKADVGLYENADKIVSMPKQIYTAMTWVLLAHASSLIAKEKKDENINLINTTIEYLLFVIYPVSFGISAISQSLVPWYMGKGFEESILLLKVFPFVLIFMGISNILRTQYFIPSQKDNTYLSITIMGMLINIFFSIFLIKRYGAIGAVIGSLLSEACMTLIFSIVAGKDFDVWKSYRYTWIYLLSSIIMYCTIRVCFSYAEPTIKTTVLQVVFGAIIYLTVTFVLSLFCSEKRMLIKKFITNVKRKKN